MKRNKGFINWFKKYTEKHKDELPCILDSHSEFEYADYVQFCEDNDLTPAPEDSQRYWDWLEEERQDSYECDRNNIKYSSVLANSKFVVVGQLGLWWGNPTIMPEIFDDFDSVIERVAEDRLKVTYDMDCFYLESSHHDGTNTFRAYMVKADANIEDLEDRIEKMKYDFDPAKNVYDRRWFEKITDFPY